MPNAEKVLIEYVERDKAIVGRLEGERRHTIAICPVPKLEIPSLKRVKAFDESRILSIISGNMGVACGVRTQVKRLNVSAQITQPLKL